MSCLNPTTTRDTEQSETEKKFYKLKNSVFAL